MVKTYRDLFMTLFAQHWSKSKCWSKEVGLWDTTQIVWGFRHKSH